MFYRKQFVFPALALCVLALGCSSPTPSSGFEEKPPVGGEGPPADTAAPAPLASQGPSGHFTLVTDEHASKVTWTAIKNGDAKVVGDFTRITGGLFLDPADLAKVDGSIEAHLDSIDSKNPVRDTNISELLFGVIAGTPSLGSVQIKKVTPEKAALEVGDSTAATVSYNLGLPSGAVPGEAAVTISRPEADRWLVTSSKPIALSLKGLSLAEESEALRERCAHESIGDGVELSLSLVFVPRRSD